MTTLLLVHGGLWEDGMDTGRFWHQPGIVAGLRRRGFRVLAPSRPHQAPDWATEATHLAATLPDPPVTVFAGSNGCSAAARLALGLRGLTDGELATLKMPIGVLPSVPANPFHQRHTADALLRLLPWAEELPGCPEPPNPGFPPHLESFLGTVAAFAAK